MTIKQVTKTENDKPSAIENEQSPERMLSILELSSFVESIDTTQLDKKNLGGMSDNNGRWIKY